MSNKQLLVPLRSFVQDAPPERIDQSNIRTLWPEAARQNLLPVLAYENRRWGMLGDAKLCRRLNGILYAALVGNLNRCTAFETLSQVFTEHGVAHMPVKGYYLRALYPVPELRTFGDIDILIRPEDRRKTHELMLSLGYTAEHDWEPSYSYLKDAEYYEIHTMLMDGNLDGRADMQTYFDGAWRYAEPDEGLRYRPAPDFHFIYTVCHLAKHLYRGGAGLRMYLDAALYVKREDARLNWLAIEKEFAALRLTDFFHTVMNACRVWFGVSTLCPLPEPDVETLDRLLDYTLDSDLFGHSRDRSVVELRNAGEKRGSKRQLVCRMLFPPADELERRYTFLQKCRWLLPVAWLARLLANIRLLPDRLARLLRISKTKAQSVDEYDCFMKAIGL